jgi:hypothetical protein
MVLDQEKTRQRKTAKLPDAGTQVSASGKLLSRIVETCAVFLKEG